MCGCGGGRSGEAAHVLGGGGDRGGRGGERLVARLTSSWAEAGVVARGTLSWVVVGVVARLTSSCVEVGVVARGTLSWAEVGVVAGEDDLVLGRGGSGGEAAEAGTGTRST